MKHLRISVKDKIATYVQRDGAIVCGNKGYKIAFTFDEEWADYPTKTARFIWNNKYFDEIFTGNECDVPVLNDTEKVTVGVYAGDLKTTTPAEIPCLISILCGNPETTDGKIKEYRDEAQAAAEEAKNSAKEAQDAAQVVVFPTIDVEEIEGGHKLTINDVEGEKTFNVMDGQGGAGSGLTEEQLKQFNDFVAWYNDEHYQAMTCKFEASPQGGTYEIGSSLEVDFEWTFDKLPSEVIFTANGIPKSATPAEKGSVKGEEVSSETPTTLTYKIYGKYVGEKTDEVEKLISFSFQNKYYYGCAPIPDKLDSAFIIGLTENGESDWATTRQRSFFVNSGSNEYVWYAYPIRLGKVSYFKSGGFQGGFEEPVVIPFTNVSGGEEDYYVYHSTEADIGNLLIEVN